MLSLWVASNPAALHCARNASPRALCPPPRSPNTSRMKLPVWRMTPGSAIVALICATPPMTAFSPRIGTSRSGASTPFWRGITAVFGPTSGRIASPADSTSHSLTQNST